MEADTEIPMRQCSTNCYPSFGAPREILEQDAQRCAPVMDVKVVVSATRISWYD